MGSWDKVDAKVLGLRENKYQKCPLTQPAPSVGQEIPLPISQDSIQLAVNIKNVSECGFNTCRLAFLAQNIQR